METNEMWEQMTDGLHIGDVEQALDAAMELSQALDAGQPTPDQYRERIHMMVESAGMVFRRAQLELNEHEHHIGSVA